MKLEKEKESRSERRRKSSKRLYYTIGAVAAVCVLVICSLTVFFRVGEIYVTGDEVPYSADEIIFNSGVETGTNIIMTVTDKASERISESLPYIESVEVIKHFPFKIEMKVKKAQIIGQIEQNGVLIVDRRGRCIDRVDKLMSGVPVIRGSGVITGEIGKEMSFGAENTLSDVTAMHDAFEKANISGITVYNTSDENKISATYQNRIVINFGTSEHLSEKLEYAVKIIEKQKDSSQTGVLNLSRIPNDKQYAYFSPEILKDDQTADVLEKK